MRLAGSRRAYTARRVTGGSVMPTLRMSSGTRACCRLVIRAATHRCHRLTRFQFKFALTSKNEVSTEPAAVCAQPHTHRFGRWGGIFGGASLWHRSIRGRPPATSQMRIKQFASRGLRGAYSPGSFSARKGPVAGRLPWWNQLGGSPTFNTRFSSNRYAISSRADPRGYGSRTGAAADLNSLKETWTR